MMDDGPFVLNGSIFRAEASGIFLANTPGI